MSERRFLRNDVDRWLRQLNLNKNGKDNSTSFQRDLLIKQLSLGVQVVLEPLNSQNLDNYVPKDLKRSLDGSGEKQQETKEVEYKLNHSSKPSKQNVSRYPAQNRTSIDSYLNKSSKALNCPSLDNYVPNNLKRSFKGSGKKQQETKEVEYKDEMDDSVCSDDLELSYFSKRGKKNVNTCPPQIQRSLHSYLNKSSKALNCLSLDNYFSKDAKRSLKGSGKKQKETKEVSEMRKEDHLGGEFKDELDDSVQSDDLELIHFSKPKKQKESCCQTWSRSSFDSYSNKSSKELNLQSLHNYIPKDVDRSSKGSGKKQQRTKESRKLKYTDLFGGEYEDESDDSVCSDDLELIHFSKRGRQNLNQCSPQNRTRYASYLNKSSKALNCPSLDAYIRKSLNRILNGSWKKQETKEVREMRIAGHLEGEYKDELDDDSVCSYDLELSHFSKPRKRNVYICPPQNQTSLDSYLSKSSKGLSMPSLHNYIPKDVDSSLKGIEKNQQGPNAIRKMKNADRFGGEYKDELNDSVCSDELELIQSSKIRKQKENSPHSWDRTCFDSYSNKSSKGLNMPSLNNYILNDDDGTLKGSGKTQQETEELSNMKNANSFGAECKDELDVSGCSDDLELFRFSKSRKQKENNLQLSDQTILDSYLNKSSKESKIFEMKMDDTSYDFEENKFESVQGENIQLPNLNENDKDEDADGGQNEALQTTKQSMSTPLMPIYTQEIDEKLNIRNNVKFRVAVPSHTVNKVLGIKLDFSAVNHMQLEDIADKVKAGLTVIGKPAPIRKHLLKRKLSPKSNEQKNLNNLLNDNSIKTETYPFNRATAQRKQNANSQNTFTTSSIGESHNRNENEFNQFDTNGYNENFILSNPFTLTGSENFNTISTSVNNTDSLSYKSSENSYYGPSNVFHNNNYVNSSSIPNFVFNANGELIQNASNASNNMILPTPSLDQPFPHYLPTPNGVVTAIPITCIPAPILYNNNYNNNNNNNINNNNINNNNINNNNYNNDNYNFNNSYNNNYDTNYNNNNNNNFNNNNFSNNNFNNNNYNNSNHSDNITCRVQHVLQDGALDLSLQSSLRYEPMPAHLPQLDLINKFEIQSSFDRNNNDDDICSLPIDLSKQSIQTDMIIDAIIEGKSIKNSFTGFYNEIIPSKDTLDMSSINMDDANLNYSGNGFKAENTKMPHIHDHSTSITGGIGFEVETSELYFNQVFESCITENKLNCTETISDPSKKRNINRDYQPIETVLIEDLEISSDSDILASQPSSNSSQLSKTKIEELQQSTSSNNSKGSVSIISIEDIKQSVLVNLTKNSPNANITDRNSGEDSIIETKSKERKPPEGRYYLSKIVIKEVKKILADFNDILASSSCQRQQNETVERKTNIPFLLCEENNSNDLKKDLNQIGCDYKQPYMTDIHTQNFDLFKATHDNYDTFDYDELDRQYVDMISNFDLTTLDFEHNNIPDISYKSNSPKPSFNQPTHTETEIQDSFLLKRSYKTQEETTSPLEKPPFLTSDRQRQEFYNMTTAVFERSHHTTSLLGENFHTNFRVEIMDYTNSLQLMDMHLNKENPEKVETLIKQNESNASTALQTDGIDQTFGISKDDVEKKSMSILEQEQQLDDNCLDFDDAISLSTSFFDSDEDELRESEMRDSNQSTTALETQKQTENKSESLKVTSIKPNASSQMLMSKKNHEESFIYDAGTTPNPAPIKMNEPSEQSATNRPSICARISQNENQNIQKENTDDQANVASLKQKFKIPRRATNGVCPKDLVTGEKILFPEGPTRLSIPSLMALDLSGIENEINQNKSIESPLQNNLRTMQIFGVTCYAFLVNQCEVINCDQSHTYRDPKNVIIALKRLNSEQLQMAYTFMYNHFNLFKRYFHIFCTIYSELNDRKKLFNMIIDCERYEICGQNLFSCYQSLLRCGFNEVNACRKLLNIVKTRSKDAIDGLLNIIIEAGWTLFISYIEEFLKLTYYKFHAQTLIKMAPDALKNPDIRFAKILFQCILKAYVEEIHIIKEAPILSYVIEKVQSYNNQMNNTVHYIPEGSYKSTVKNFSFE